jgi:predicted nucleic acid-binding Zn ribbon protein
MSDPDLIHPKQCPYCGESLSDDCFVCLKCKNITVSRHKKNKPRKATVIILIVFISILLMIFIYRIWEITVQNRF